MPDMPYIIAQGRDFDWTNLLYLLIFLVFPALNALGEWIREHFNKNKEGQHAQKGEKEYEVVIEDGEIVLKPHQRGDRKKPASSPTAPQPPKPVQAEFRPDRPGPPAPPQPGPARWPQPQTQAPARPASKPQPPAPRRPAPQARPAQPHHHPRRPARKAQPVPSRRTETPTDPRAIMATMIEKDSDKRRSREPATQQPAVGKLAWDRQSVRNAIVMKEILGPPIALRNRDDDALF